MNQNSKNLNLTEEIFYQAQSYTIICFVGIVASMTYNICSGILRALGDSKAPFYFLYAIRDVLSGAIKGIGNTLYPMIINIFGICICRILWVFFIVPLNTTFFTVLYRYIVSWIITVFMYIICVIYKRKNF
jgi:Na+ driven multidrug efflux pump